MIPDQSDKFKLLPQHLDDLKRSGLSDETIAACGFFSCDDHERIELALGWQSSHKFGPCLVIPFFDPATGERIKNYSRIKPDNPRVSKKREDRGRIIKYESRLKTPNRAYILPSVREVLAELAPVLITEGEKKTAKAIQEGFPTIGLVGVWGWQKKRPKNKAGRGEGLRELIDDLAGIAWKGRRAVIVYDSDAASKPEIQFAEKALAQTLALLGATVKIVRLPEGQASDGAKVKAGLDDYLIAHTADELRALIDATPEFEAGAATIITTGPGLRPWEKVSDPHYLARQLLETYKHDDASRLAYYRERFWTWEGNWSERSDAEMFAHINQFIKWRYDEMFRAIYAAGDIDPENPPMAPQVTKALVGNVAAALGGLSMIPATTPMNSWLDNDSPGRRELIAFDNGLLDVAAFLAGSASPLMPHTPLWFSPVKFPYAFDPVAECPLWLKFLDRNLEGRANAKAAMLQQFIGYLLLPDCSRQRFLLLLGEGSNGKSVICAVMRAVLGELNCVAVPIELFGTRFHLEPTVGKLANIVAEVGELDKIAEGTLKAFTAGDLMQFEQKFKSPYMAVPTARLVIATNNAPDFRDKSDGLWRRMLTISCSVQIPDKDKVSGMEKPEWWTDKGELPGILNWALMGLYHLRQSGAFMVPPEIQAQTDKLRGEANPAGRFLVENYQAASGQVEKQLVYGHYKSWCSVNGHHALASNKFGAEVHRKFRGVKDGTATVRRDLEYGEKGPPQRVTVYEGIEPVKPN